MKTITTDPATAAGGTSKLPVGPAVDLIPYVSTDGQTIQMTLVASMSELLGNEPPVSGRKPGTPLPRIRVRQVATTVTVLDGQTAVIGGAISGLDSNVKNPSSGSRKAFVVFVTATVIDAAGNRVHPQ